MLLDPTENRSHKMGVGSKALNQIHTKQFSLSQPRNRAQVLAQE